MIKYILCLISYDFYINYVTTNFLSLTLSDDSLLLGYILINIGAWLFIFILLHIFKFVILFIGNNIL